VISPALAKSPGGLRLLALNRVISPDEAAQEAIDRAWGLRFEDPRGMLDWSRMALELARSPGVAALAHAHLGNANRVNARLAVARLHLDLATRHGVCVGPLLLEFRASLLKSVNKLEAALASLGIAANMRAEEGHPDGRAKVLTSIGQVLDAAGRYSEAAEVLQEALETAVADTAVVRSAVHILAHSLSKLGQPERALSVLQKAEPVLETPGLTQGLRGAWLRGLIAMRCGDEDPAFVNLEKALTGFTSVGLSYETCMITIHLATLHTRCGHIKEARRLFKRVPNLLSRLDALARRQMAVTAQIALGRYR
jgi:tetratricopeptide (TPR) repeat protein